MALHQNPKFIHWQIWATQDPFTKQWVMHSPNFGLKDTAFSHQDFYFCRAMVINSVARIINAWKARKAKDKVSLLDMKENKNIQTPPVSYKVIPVRSL